MDETDATQTDLMGREAVRVYFVQRLQSAGLARGKGMSEKDHADMLRHLIDFLSYLSVPSIETLADQVLDAAAGPKRNQWPSELVVRQMAEALEARPFEEKPIVRSWLASKEGPIAEAGGYLVELFRFLREHPRPIFSHDRRTISAQADQNRRNIYLIRDRQRLGDDRAEDRQWMQDYEADQARAREIVDRGRQARAAKQSEGAGQ